MDGYDGEESKIHPGTRAHDEGTHIAHHLGTHVRGGGAHPHGLDTLARGRWGRVGIRIRIARRTRMGTILVVLALLAAVISLFPIPQFMLSAGSAGIRVERVDGHIE